MRRGNWTVEQKAAIKLRGQILVAAAAGSGKTAVLVERLIQRITDTDEPDDIDRFLVVTFTKAAANEMRERIGKALDDALFQAQETAEVERLLRQRALLQRASITTLHAFCLELIRKHFYRLELDPAFRVADQAEADLLCQDVLEDLFEEKYADDDQAFLQLVDIFGSDRDDRGLADCVLSLYSFACSQPDPESWLSNLNEAYTWTDGASLLNSIWGQALRQGLRHQVSACLTMLEQAWRIVRAPGGPALYDETLQDDVRRVRLLKERIQNGQWAEIQEQLQVALDYGKLPAIRAKSTKNTSAQIMEHEEEARRKTLQEECRKLRDEAKKTLSALKSELFAYAIEDQIVGLREMGKVAQALGNLAWSLAEAYNAAKKRRNVLDFNDLEHFALRLLLEQGEDSLLARSLQAYFVEVLVDEYQDINPVQERIIELVSKSRESTHLFMVGDVKQSIYRFRMSDPSLFLTKYRTLPHWSPKAANKAVALDLNRNFRSRLEIVEGINFLFRQIMTEEVGEICYDDQAALQYGASFLTGQNQVPTAEGPIEVHIIDRRMIKVQGGAETRDEGGIGSGEELAEVALAAEDLDKTRIEARLLGDRIHSLVEEGEFHIYDQKLKDFRPVRYADVVVLMRSYAGAAPIYAEEFQMVGIPVYAETSTGYFDASEVETMLSLLKIIDNPHQDIPLAAVLRSPLVGLNGSELGKLRLMLPEGDFYEALALAVLAAGDDGIELQAAGDLSELRRILYLYEVSLLPRLEKAKDILAEAPNLRTKTTGFWLRLRDWRTRARRGALADLLWYLYEETGYLTYVRTLPSGAQRQANLQVLYERAKRFEATRYRGLFRFLRFLERFREQGKDMGNARPLGETEDVVRLLTVHASKGQEFPVVFVAGLGRKFNTKSYSGKFLLHTKLGLGLPIIDGKQRVRYPSLIQYALRERLKQESLAEELRILYVALTRAKERLFLYGTVDNAEKTLQKWQSVSDYPETALPEGQLQSAKCFLDWIGLALSRHPEQLWGEVEVCRGLPDLKNGSRWAVLIHAGLEAGIPGGTLADIEDHERVWAGEKPHRKDEVVEFYLAEVERRLSWQYSHIQAVRQVAKTSVSELKRQWNWSANEETVLLAGLEQRLAPWKRPKFLQAARPLTAAERGTALHVVMQHIPFRKWSGIWSDLTPKKQLACILGFLEELEKGEVLSREQKNSIQPTAITQFLNTRLAERFFCAEEILREIPFTLSLRLTEAEPVLIQGVIDVVLLNRDGDGELWVEIIDYKTDFLRGEKITNDNKGTEDAELEQVLRERYELQISVYALAAERLMQANVSQCTAYAFALGREITWIRDNDLTLASLRRAVTAETMGV